jgi:hypothetical protein
LIEIEWNGKEKTIITFRTNAREKQKQLDTRAIERFDIFCVIDRLDSIQIKKRIGFIIDSNQSDASINHEDIWGLGI